MHCEREPQGSHLVRSTTRVQCSSHRLVQAPSLKWPSGCLSRRGPRTSTKDPGPLVPRHEALGQKKEAEGREGRGRSCAACGWLGPLASRGSGGRFVACWLESNLERGRADSDLGACTGA